MKRITTLIVLILLLPLGAGAGENVKKSRLSSFISEYRYCDGVELVRLGPLATSAIKATVRISAAGDKDAIQTLRALGGVKKLMVFDYEDCRPELKEKISRRLKRILDDSELLLEAKDGQDGVRIYGITDGEGETVRDLVLHAPGDCALICVFGKISMDSIAKLIDNND